MKKIISVLLILSIVLPVYSEDPVDEEEILNIDPAPYDDDEFPQWARDLRRAEIIFFGSTPFTFLFSAAGYRTGRYVFNSITAEPGESIPGWNELGQDDQINMIYISLGLSLSIAVIDFILGRIGQNHNEDTQF